MLEFKDYPAHSIEKVRFSDTDKFGHVNNTVFGVYMETGRSEFLHGGADDLADAGCQFVSVRIEMDYHAELNWPGDIMLGLRIVTVGNSSVTMEQGLFQHGKRCASALSVIVQFDPAIRKAKSLSARAKERFAAYIVT